MSVSLARTAFCREMPPPPESIGGFESRGGEKHCSPPPTHPGALAGTSAEGARAAGRQLAEGKEEGGVGNGNSLAGGFGLGKVVV